MIDKWLMLIGMLVAFIYILYTGKILIDMSLDEEEPSTRIFSLVFFVVTVSAILYSMIYHMNLGLKIIFNGGL